MSLHDLHNSTLREISNRLRGHFEREQAQTIEAWRRTRMEIYYSLLPHRKKGSTLKPKDIFLLPDEKPAHEHYTAKNRKAIEKEFARRMASRKAKS